MARSATRDEIDDFDAADNESRTRGNETGIGTIIFVAISLAVGAYGGFALWTQLAANREYDRAAAERAAAAATAAGPYTVQLAAVRVRAIVGNRNIASMVTPYVEVRNAGDVNAVCAHVPVVRDAVSRVIEEDNRRAGYGDTDFAGLAGSFRTAINSGLKSDVVMNVKVVRGRVPYRVDTASSEGETVTECLG